VEALYKLEGEVVIDLFGPIKLNDLVMLD